MQEVELEYGKQMRQGLANEFCFVEPDAVKRKMKWMFGGGVALALLSMSPLPVILSVTVIWGMPYAFLRIIQKRRRKLFEKQLGQALPQISSILHAGHSFERALEALVRSHPNPLAQELQMVLKEVRLGSGLDEALESLLVRFPSKDLEVVTRAVGISRRVGSNLAESFDRVAEMIRGRNALRDKLQALTAQGKVQAWVAISMPIGMSFVLRFVSPDYLDPLFYHWIGQLTIGVSILMMLIGGIWIHKISKMELVR
jgi:tight adherence protein B